MSQKIKLMPEDFQELRDEFEKALGTMKMADGRLSFSKSFKCESRKATIHFTSAAWDKMFALVREFDKEIAWHGVAFRADNEDADDYVITDIVVYPQAVSAASVDMDTEEYAKWLMKNDEDERFSHLFMQGHSHVDFGVTASSVDLKHQSDILDMLGDEDFYIFLICNKSGAISSKIYDLKKNILFENTDITVLHAENELDGFVKEARSMVKNLQTPVGGAASYRRSGVTQTYNNPASTGGPYNPMAYQSNITPIDPTPADKGKENTGKGSRPKTKIGAGWAGADQLAMMDEMEDPRNVWPYH